MTWTHLSGILFALMSAAMWGGGTLNRLAAMATLATKTATITTQALRLSVNGFSSATEHATGNSRTISAFSPNSLQAARCDDA